MRVHFSLICAIGFLNASDRSSLEQISFLYQLINTFRVGLLRT